MVLQHLRESFSLSYGEATPYWFLLIRYNSNPVAVIPAKAGI
ncbi:hypothetical protein OIG31_09430 [Neisseria meningitidis]|nr:hypothetical protein [Neisseria meningitidis]MCV6781281.1 hypothetical protein [Neisseria meningitidis]